MEVLCVLKSGGDFTPDHVYALEDMVARHLTIDYKFRCLSDLDLDCDTIPLDHDWPGWWAKIELFRQLGPVLYFDLDTIIHGNIDEIVSKAVGKNFVILRDAYRGKLDETAMQSSIMFWQGDHSYLYRKFHKFPFNIPGGDQVFIENNVQGEVTYWQDLTDGIKSYKADLLPKQSVDESDRIIFFHGRPRPWQQEMVPYVRRTN